MYTVKSQSFYITLPSLDGVTSRITPTKFL